MTQGSHWNERDTATINNVLEDSVLDVGQEVTVDTVELVRGAVTSLLDLSNRERERADANARKIDELRAQIKGMKEIAAVFWSGRVQ